MNYKHTVGGKTLGFPECAKFVTDMSLVVTLEIIVITRARGSWAFSFEATAQCRPPLLAAGLCYTEFYKDAHVRETPGAVLWHTRLPLQVLLSGYDIEYLLW